MQLENHVVSVAHIDIGDRFRKEMGDIEELAEDIRQHGLINPITLKRCNDNTFVLVAGERRLRACMHNGMEEVPARIYDHDLSDLELRSIELSENLRRKDMTFLEELQLKKQIHELQVAIHGGVEKKAGRDEGWSKRDTASLLDIAPSGLHMDLQLADKIEQFPEIDWTKCKNKNEANKVAKKLEEQLITRELAKRIEASSSTGGIEAKTKRMIESFIIRDFFEAAKELDAGTFDIVEIDPPYAIELEDIKKNYGYGDTYNEVAKKKYIPFLRNTFEESYRLLNNNGWLICWFAPEPWFEVVYKLLVESKFMTNRMCGIWAKPTGQTNQPNRNMANAYEMFFYARKGDPVLAKQGRSNIFTFNPVPPQNKIHPTERPLELMDEVLTTFGFPGSKVLVPFAGSGNTLRSAYRVGMNPIGFDLSKVYKESYAVRVAAGC